MSEREHTKQRVEKPIPAWFRQEHEIQIIPDSSFGLYAGDGEVGIRQVGDSPVEFAANEAAFLFGDSSDQLYFRASFFSFVKIDGANEEEKTVREKLYGTKIATFCDYSGPVTKTYHGIAVYRDALDDMIPQDNPTRPDFSVVEEDFQSSIDMAMQQGHGECLGRCRMNDNDFYNYEVFMSNNRCLVIVRGDLSGNWLAEEDPVCDEPPLWFSEVDHRPSPVYQAQRCRDFFLKNIHGIPVFAMVVLPKNVFLLNEDDMRPVWREKSSVYMTRTGKNPNSGLPTLHDCLNALPEATETPSSAALENLQGLVKRLERNPMEWEQA